MTTGYKCKDNDLTSNWCNFPYLIISPVIWVKLNQSTISGAPALQIENQAAARIRNNKPFAAGQ